MSLDFFGSRPKADPQQINAIKEWAFEVFRLAADIVVMVTELRCTEPGCPPLETVIAILDAPGRPRQFKIHKALADVSVRANPLTGNVLILFDRQTSNEKTLLAELQEAWDRLRAAQQRQAPRSEPPARDGTGQPVESGGPTRSLLIRVGVRGLLGHAALDSLWFGARFLGSALSLPLAGLGLLHVLMDIAVWGVALGSVPHLSPPSASNTQ